MSSLQTGLDSPRQWTLTIDFLPSSSELKDRLRALKLPLKGKKAELVARLQAAASVSTVQGPLQPTRATLGTSAVGSSATRPALPDPAPAGNIASIPRAKESASKGKEQAFSVLAEPSTPKKPRFDPPSASHRTPALLSRPTHAPAFASGPKKPGTPLNPAVWGSPPAHLASARLDRTLARPEQFLLTGNTSTEPTRGAAAAKKPTRAPFKPLIVSTRRASSARSPPSSAPRIPTFVPPNSLLPTNVSPPDAWPERLYASLVPPLPFPSIPPSLMSQTEAAALAHRVIVSRLYLILGRASYSSPGEAKAVLESLPPVLGAQRVVEGLWLVMLGDGTKVHVLEATGEVVGSEAEIEELQLGQPNPVLELHLRADWAAWIEDRKKGRGKRLHELVKGGDVEEYPEGLSKGMRTKAASDQDLAASAVKYLLAQVTVSCTLIRQLLLS